MAGARAVRIISVSCVWAFSSQANVRGRSIEHNRLDAGVDQIAFVEHAAGRADAGLHEGPLLEPRDQRRIVALVDIRLAAVIGREGQQAARRQADQCRLEVVEAADLIAAATRKVRVAGRPDRMGRRSCSCHTAIDGDGLAAKLRRYQPPEMETRGASSCLR